VGLGQSISGVRRCVGISMSVTYDIVMALVSVCARTVVCTTFFWRGGSAMTVLRAVRGGGQRAGGQKPRLHFLTVVTRHPME